MKRFIVESDPETAYYNGVLFFTQKTPANAMSANAHIHNSIEIIFVETGSFTVYSDEEKYEIFAGDVILFRSNVIHHIFAGSEEQNSYNVLKLRPEILREIALPSMGGLYLLNFMYKNNGAKNIWRKDEAKELAYGYECLKNELKNDAPYRDVALKLAAGNVLLGMLRSGADSGAEGLSKSDNRTADCIYNAIYYINQNYMHDITENDVSSEVGMSYHYFSRIFKTVTGQTFKQYLNKTRIANAERLLATTDKTVSEISAECGYNDASYFIKVYKKIKQYAPGTSRSRGLSNPK